MHTKSSINIKPISGNSEAHNLRTGKPLSYVKQERTELNQSWTKESLHDARARINKTYKKNVGQKMQAKATPIREGVVNLGKKQNLETLKTTCEKIEERFKIKAIQIHIHEDEGHHRVKSGEWKQNRHAHIVFDWTDDQGRSVKLKKNDMAELQTLVADSLGMQRGQSSDKKHLNSMEYKIQEMEKDAIQLEKDLKKLKATIKAQEYGENIKKGLSETFKVLGGVSTAKKLKEELKTLKNDFLALGEEKKLLEKNIDSLEKKNQTLDSEKKELEHNNRVLSYKLTTAPTAAQYQKIEKKAATWFENCKKMATGELPIAKVKDFMVKNGHFESQNQGPKMSR